MSVDGRHAFQILEQLGAEADRLGVRAVDMYGRPGSVAEFLNQIALYITARENEADQLREALMGATLTDAEREAVARAAKFADDAAGYCQHADNAELARKNAAILRGLLERTGGRCQVLPKKKVS